MESPAKMRIPRDRMSEASGLDDLSSETERPRAAYIARFPENVFEAAFPSWQGAMLVQDCGMTNINSTMLSADSTQRAEDLAREYGTPTPF